MPSPQRTRQLIESLSVNSSTATTLATAASRAITSASEETLADDKVLTTADVTFQKLDPGGAHRDVTLPAEASSAGMWFLISNAADAAENLVVKDDTPATVVTINQNEAAVLVCDGTSWIDMGVLTIALT